MPYYASTKRTHLPACFQVGLSSLKTRSRSSFRTKTGHCRLAPSRPKSLKNALGSTIRCAWRLTKSPSPYGCLITRAWSARTPLYAFKSASLFKPRSRSSFSIKSGLGRLVPSELQISRYACDCAIRCPWRLKQVLGETKIANTGRILPPVCFQVGLSR